MWQTDVVISNLGSKEAVVQIVLHDESFTSGRSVRTVRAGQTIAIRDILQSEFHRVVSHGWLRIYVPSEDAVIAASARVYNINGTSGEYGTQVPALPLVTLGKEATLGALSGIAGNRTNFGIANPDDYEYASIKLQLFDGNGELRQTSFTTVRPASMLFLNDLFTTMGVAPFENARLEVTSSFPVYAFASVINASGDSDFIAGVARDRAVSDILPPACAQPATIGLAIEPAPGYIVVYVDGTNAVTRTAELGAKYGFTADTVYSSALFGFYSRKLSPAAIAGLRCEADVRFIEQNAFAHLSARP